MERRIVAVGASAGGVSALKALVRDLPVDLPAPVLIVLHLPPESPGVLPQILSRAGPLPVEFAQDGQPWKPGHIYVGPTDVHLLVNEDKLMLRRGPTENSVRP